MLARLSALLAYYGQVVYEKTVRSRCSSLHSALGLTERSWQFISEHSSSLFCALVDKRMLQLTWSFVERMTERRTASFAASEVVYQK